VILLEQYLMEPNKKYGEVLVKFTLFIRLIELYIKLKKLLSNFQLNISKKMVQVMEKFKFITEILKILNRNLLFQYSLKKITKIIQKITNLLTTFFLRGGI